VPGDEHRGVGVFEDVRGDGAEPRTTESRVAAGAEHDHQRVARLLGQRPRRRAVDHPGPQLDSRVLGPQVLEVGVELGGDPGRVGPPGEPGRRALPRQQEQARGEVGDERGLRA
jgi:hypothetical protein